jgi:hypothetical protein
MSQNRAVECWRRGDRRTVIYTFCSIEHCNFIWSFYHLKFAAQGSNLYQVHQKRDKMIVNVLHNCRFFDT